MTVADACNQLGLTESTVRHHIRRGELESTRMGRRVWLSVRSVSEFAQDREGRISESDAAELVGCSRETITRAVGRKDHPAPGLQSGCAVARARQRSGVQGRVGRAQTTSSGGQGCHGGEGRPAAGRRSLAEHVGDRGAAGRFALLGSRTRPRGASPSPLRFRWTVLSA